MHPVLGNSLYILLHGMCKDLHAIPSGWRPTCIAQRSVSQNVAFQRILECWEPTLLANLQHGMENMRRCIARWSVTFDEDCLFRFFWQRYTRLFWSARETNLAIRFFCEQYKKVVGVMFQYSDMRLCRLWQEEVRAQVLCSKLFWIKFCFLFW